MRTGAGAVFVLVLSFATAGAWSIVRAEPAADAVVAKIGPATITALAVERRMRAVPDFQLATFGHSPDEIKRRFLEQVMIPDALLAEGARAKKLEQRPEVEERVDAALRVARIDELKSELSVQPDDIAAFYAQNRARFDSPERVAVFRILCTTQEEATQVIAEAKASGGLQRWNDLAREKSIDKPTSFRGGNLGLLAADGTSSEVAVRADPALFAAASHVKDGEIVAEPVKEGSAFAVIWRRGSTPAVHRTQEEESSAISQVVMRKKLAEALRGLLAKLRAERHVEESPELVESIEVDASGEVAPKKRPGVAPHKSALPPAPSATLRGLR